jgi:hypothetical protein
MAGLAIIGGANVIDGFGVTTVTSADHVCMVYGLDRSPGNSMVARFAGVAAGYMVGAFNVAIRTCANDLAMVHATDIQPA